ncbi:MAG: hypothetical protein CMJ18_24830 [Phycisphaeraceae bacterium]|nr:hypothetical protein [Phycisphaeraceae bacterium]
MLKKTLQNVMCGSMIVLFGCSAPGVDRGVGRNIDSGRPLAYVNSQLVGMDQLQPLLIEASGGEVLAEYVLTQLIDARLSEQGLAVGDREVEREREFLLESLSDDPAEAQRLLVEVRRRRGLGATRFPAMLRRNAGLRLLVQENIAITDQSLRDTYQLIYGPRYECRLITVDAIGSAGEVARRAGAGESFGALASRFSTHVSADRGGVMPPISPQDSAYPAELLRVLGQMQPGEASDPIAVETGFAILKLERVIAGSSIPFEQVRGDVARIVRRRTERMLQEKLARELLAAAEVTVLDRHLATRWRRRIGDVLSTQ